MGEDIHFPHPDNDDEDDFGIKVLDQKKVTIKFLEITGFMIMEL